jgi:hypothetical protein
MKKTIIWFAAILFTVGALSWCSQSNSNETNRPETTLNQQQKDQLVFIIQEEKLARDVYSDLYSKRKNKKFYNIINSEENHQYLVQLILEKYSIPNPIEDKNSGEFENQELSSLYKTLITQWNISVEEAMKVWVAIEQKDIKDLEDMMKLYWDYPDITATLQKLLEWSQRHLNAFQK